MKDLPKLTTWTDQMVSQINANPSQLFDINQYATIDQVILKLILLTTKNSQYGYDHADTILVAQELTNLKRQHPETDLDDLKSLSNWYPQLKQHPDAWVYNPNDPNHQVNPKLKKSLLTNELAAQLLPQHEHAFVDDQFGTLQLAEYLLTEQDKLNQFIDEDAYHIIYRGLFDTVWSETDYYYQFFKTSEEVDENLQSDIHEIAMQDDYMDDDDDISYGPSFDGYRDETIEALIKAIKVYENYRKRNQAIVYYLPDADFKQRRPAKLVDVVNIMLQNPVRKVGIIE